MHAIVDPGAVWLSKLLQDATKNRGSDSFEHYVVSLLQLCGIPAVRYGFKSPEHAPDIVAEIDGENVLIGECKIVPPTTEMLETLVNRARSIVQYVHGPKRLGLRVVFFHAKDRDQVSDQAARFAASESVSLLGRDRLHKLQDQWERGEPREVLLKTLIE